LWLLRLVLLLKQYGLLDRFSGFVFELFREFLFAAFDCNALALRTAAID